LDAFAIQTITTMKFINKILTLLMLSGALVFSSCSDDSDTPTNDDQNNDNTTETSTIVDLAAGDTSLSILVSALEAADLTGALAMDGNMTVFAPTNDAFRALLASNDDWNSLDDIDPALLELVLKFHVLASEVRSTDLGNVYVPTLAMGPNDEAISLQVNVEGGVTFNGNASPIDVDIEADNGVIHTIDAVMLPPNVVALALNNSGFSTLVAALTRSDLTTDYVAVLNGDGPYTIFAPNNDAFAALLSSNEDWSSLDDIPVATLEAVLNYHVVSGANVQSDELSDDQTVGTLGGDLTVDLMGSPSLETGSGQNVNIIATDVQGTNGVIHVVEEVLLP